MMRRMTKKLDIRIESGTQITGKWYRNRYHIIKLLGSGGQGTVYLAHSSRGRVAVKFGKDRSSLTSEVNVLKRLAKVQGEPLGPSLYDVDDYVTRYDLHDFYVMEYINGTSLTETFKIKGFEWVGIFILQLLKDLERLHVEGWIFGDLKPDNLIVTGPPWQIRWLDVGGMTLLGRSVKEYTEFFDRGYWGLGSRKAEASYDLFAVAMIIIYAVEGKRFEKSQQPEKQLLDVIRNQPKLAAYQSVLIRAITGKYLTAQAMRTELLLKMNETSSHPTRRNKRSYPPTQPVQRRRQKNRRRNWVPTLLLTMGLITAYFIYLMFCVM